LLFSSKHLAAGPLNSGVRSKVKTVSKSRKWPLINVILVGIGAILSAVTIYATSAIWMLVPHLDTLRKESAQRLILKHVPGYGQFYIQDPRDYEAELGTNFEQAIGSTRLYCGEGQLAVFVVSEYTELPITVDFHPKPPPSDASAKWDRVVECSLDIASGHIVFAGCPDGPIYGKFGEIVVRPGRYRIRVHYGGQSTVQLDGSSSDFYLVQIWPSDKNGIVVLKPSA
jgi:hypothetical protein